MEEKTHLKNLVVRGIGWLVLKRVFTQVILTSSNLILVRLLFPKDFGTFAILQFLVTISWVFADLGLSKALIQHYKRPTPKLLCSIWWVQVGLGLLVASIIWITGPGIISYYGGQLGSQSIWWLRILVASQILANMSSISAALLEKRLAYGKVLIGESIGLFSTQTTTTVFAFLGFGVGSFVFGNLLGKVVTLVLLFYLAPWPWGINFDWRVLKPLLSFGIPFQMGGWLGIINGAVIPVFVGRFPGPGGFSGPEAVGFVTWAAGVAAIPAAMLNIIDQVLFPLISKLQKDLKLAERYFQRALQFSIITTLGGVVLILALSPEITKIVYTERWLPAVPALKLATLQVALMTITALTMNALLALGQARFFRNMHLLWAALQWVLTIPLVAIFGFWGVSLAGVIVTATGLFALLRLNKYFKIQLFAILGKPMFAAVTTGLLIYYLAPIIQIDNIVKLLSILLLGIVLYFSLIYLLLRREFIRDFRLILQIVRGI